MQTIKLTPEDKRLIGKVTGKEDVTVICDSTNAAFAVDLYDASMATGVNFYILNIGANVVTLNAPTGQYLNDVWYVTLEQWDCYSIIPFDGKWYIINKKTNRFGSETNYTEFGTDGFQTAYGDAQGWNDIQIPIASGKVPSVNYPNWSSFTTHLSAYTFDVDDFIDCRTVEWEHDSLENAIGYVHVHWATNQLEASAKNVKYRVYYTIGKNGVAFPDDSYVESSADIVIPANTPHRTSFVSYLGQINLSGYGVGTQIKTGFMRIASTGTAPANNPFIGQIGIHNKRDTPLGSKEMYSK